MGTIQHVSIIILLAVLVFISVPIDGFRTERCGHKKLIKILGKTNACLNSTEQFKDLCTRFTTIDSCVRKYMDRCFEEDQVTDISEQVMGDLREETKKIMMTPEYSKQIGLDDSFTELQVEILLNITFANCTVKPNGSIESFKQIIGLEHFTTDDNCTKEGIEDFNIRTGECTVKKEEDMKNEKYETYYSKSEKYSFMFSYSKKETALCSMFGKTVGKCFKAPMPQCLSYREKQFIKKSIADHYKAREYSVTWVKNDMYDLLSNYNEKLNEFHWKDGKLSKVVTLSNCYVLDEKNIFPELKKTSPGSTWNKNSYSIITKTTTTNRSLIISVIIISFIILTFFVIICKIRSDSRTRRRWVRATPAETEARLVNTPHRNPQTARVVNIPYRNPQPARLVNPAQRGEHNSQPAQQLLAANPSSLPLTHYDLVYQHQQPPLQCQTIQESTLPPPEHILGSPLPPPSYEEAIESDN